MSSVRIQTEISRQGSPRMEDVSPFFSLSRDMFLTIGEDGFIAQSSPAARALGYSEQEIASLRLIDLVHPEARAEVQGELQNLVSGGPAVRFQHRAICSDGSEVWMDWAVSRDISGTSHAVLRDVSERKWIENEVETSLAVVHATLEHAVEGICCVDKDRRCVSVNVTYAALLETDPKKLLGSDWLTTIHPDDREKVLAACEQAKAEGKLKIQARALRARGAPLHQEILVVPAWDGQRTFVGYYFFIKDMTEEIQLQSRLLFADRMASVGTLAAGVAHEINNPLAFVIVNLGVLEERLPRLLAEVGKEKAGDIPDIVHDMREGTERVRQIVRDLRIFSRPGEDVPTPVDVNDVMDFAIHMAANEIRHRARLVKKYDHLPIVNANQSRLGQVFLNLLVNASQAIREGDIENNQISVTTLRPDNERVVVEVRDTGTGIPAEVLDRIFDPFFTTKPVGMGTGLGLSVCHGIISGLGGEITVESEVGKGTTFRVILPVGKGNTLARPAARPVATSTRRGRILIVDDEEMLARSIERVLSGEHDVVTSTGGREALDLLAKDANFDVILCDLMMPKTSGMDVYAELMHLRPALAQRIIFMTGGAFTTRAQEFLEHVPNVRLEKPVYAQHIRTTVRDAMMK